MRHQGRIGEVIAAELAKIEAVGEVLAEQLGEAGHAGIERVAAEVDDLGARQGEMDQPGEAEVVGPLVDDPRRVRRRRPHPRQVGAAQSLQPLAGKPRRPLRKADRLRLQGRPEGLGLAGGEHPGMAGQDLLHQGGARPRHADDEHGELGHLALPGLALHQLGRERRSRPAQRTEHRGLVVIDLQPLQGVSVQQALDRPRVVPDVGESLPQGEIEIDPLVGGQGGRLPPQGLHGGEAWIARLEAPDFGEVVVEAGPARRQGDGALEGGRGLIEAAQFEQQQTPVVVGFCIARIEGDGLIEALQRRQGLARCSRRALAAGQGLAAVVQRLGVVRLQRQSPLEADHRVGRPLQIDQGHPAVVEGDHVIRPGRQGAVVARQRLGWTAEVAQRRAAIAERRDMIGPLGQGQVIAGQGLVEPPQPRQGRAAPVQDVRLAGIQRQGAVKGRQRFFRPAPGVQHRPQPRQGHDMVRLDRQHAPIEPRRLVQSPCLVAQDGVLKETPRVLRSVRSRGRSLHSRPPGRLWPASPDGYGSFRGPSPAPIAAQAQRGRGWRSRQSRGSSSPTT